MSKTTQKQKRFPFDIFIYILFYCLNAILTITTSTKTKWSEKELQVNAQKSLAGEIMRKDKIQPFHIKTNHLYGVPQINNILCLLIAAFVLN